MRWYHGLYTGEMARPRRFRIVAGVKAGRLQDNVYLLTLPSNPQNLLDIYPAWVLRQKYFRKADLLVVGIALGYREAVELAAKIMNEIYEETGIYSTAGYFREG